MQNKTVRNRDENSLFVHNKISVHLVRKYKQENKIASVDVIKCHIDKCCEIHTHKGWNSQTAIDNYVVNKWCNTCQKNSFKIPLIDLLAYPTIADITVPCI